MTTFLPHLLRSSPTGSFQRGIKPHQVINYEHISSTIIRSTLSFHKYLNLEIDTFHPKNVLEVSPGKILSISFFNEYFLTESVVSRYDIVRMINNNTMKVFPRQGDISRFKKMFSPSPSDFLGRSVQRFLSFDHEKIDSGDNFNFVLHIIEKNDFSEKKYSLKICEDLSSMKDRLLPFSPLD